MNAKPADIDAYLATVAEPARATLEQVRQTVKSLVPDALEAISYGMPAFTYRGKYLIYVAAAKNHCAHYGTSAGTTHFAFGQAPSADDLRPLLEARIAAIDAKSVRR